MANLDRISPTPSQAREYILTLLEGLAGLAEAARDADTRDRIDGFARSLLQAWSSPSASLLAKEFGRLDELTAAYAVEQPGALAIVVGDCKITYAQLEDSVDRLGAALQREGLVKGDVIALCAGTSAPYIALFLAASRVGVIVAPLATWIPVDQICTLAADSGAKRLFTDIVALTDLSVAPVVMMGELEAWMAPAGARPRAVKIGPDDVHYIMYSSGTTGAPKGIVQSYLSRWRGLVEFGSAPVRASYIVSTPLYASSTIFAWGKPLACGGVAVMMPKFDALGFLFLAETWRVTNAVLVPVQVQRILAHPDFDSFDLGSFMNKLVVGAPFDPALKAETVRRWPGGLSEFYGVSEGGVACLLDASQRPDKLHTVGEPLAACDLRVIDDEGRELPRGAIGEIVGRARVMMQGYHNQPDATEKALWFDDQGRRYIRSGDIGRIDEDGFVQLLGRKKDMIVSGGQNIYPCDLEAVLQRHPAVQDVAVVGRISARWGEEPVVFATLNPGAGIDAGALLAWVCERVGKPQRPAEVIILDELPRSPIGKILKRQLRALFQAA